MIEIFERYALGEGYKQIAWALNQRKVPAPRAQRGRPSGWEPSTIRSVLDRPLYRGVYLWNRSKKRDAEGEQNQRMRPRNEWVEVKLPDLRIVSEALEVAVDERRRDRAARYLRSATGQLIGRPPATTPRYLLSGLMVCSCGARYEALKGGNWSYHGSVYVCAARRRKGPSVCSNALTLPIAEMDAKVLDIVEDAVLTPSFVRYVVNTLVTEEPENRLSLTSERARIAREVENLTKAIAMTDDDMPSLVQMLKDRDKTLKSLDAKLAPRPEPNRQQLEDALLRRIEDWRGVLRSNLTQARMVLQHVLGEINVYDIGEIPSWAATPRPEGLLAGMVHGLASPTGFAR